MIERKTTSQALTSIPSGQNSSRFGRARFIILSISALNPSVQTGLKEPTPSWSKEKVGLPKDNHR